MIKTLRLLRSIGHFQCVDSGKEIDLSKLTLVYGDNGRGKTTLAAVLRSLAKNDPSPIAERKRFEATDEPKVVIGTGDGLEDIVFEHGEWNRSLPQVVVFDETFVEENVYSGLTVSSSQRQHLHDLILGPEAVQLQGSLDEQIEAIEQHGREIQNYENALRPHLPEGFNIAQFCLLEPETNIDERINEAQKTLSAALEHEEISRTPKFELLNLPSYDLSTIDEVLSSTLEVLEQEAMSRVQQHFESLGNGIEAWIADGMGYISNEAGPDQICPFCGTSVDGSVLIQHYQGYFSEAYSALKKRISNLLHDLQTNFGPSMQASFEQVLRVAVQRQQIWGRFCSIEPISLDTTEIFLECEKALRSLVKLLGAKQASPLDALAISSEQHEAVESFAQHALRLGDLNGRLEEANVAIEELKAKVSSVNIEDVKQQLRELRAAKIRHTTEVALLCDGHLREHQHKAEAENKRKEIRRDLDEHRKIVFPTYQSAVNQVLDRFGTEFRLVDLKHENRRSGSTTTFGAQVGATSVDVGSAGSQIDPLFGFVLSGGDRTTLALAFFLASLEQSPTPDDTIVVIDDPISSMDAGRALTTVQVTRELAGKYGQVIVLSHEKQFLCHIAAAVTPAARTALEITRVEEGSSLATWDISEESLTEHDVRSREFLEFLQFGTGDKRQIAANLRPHLEGFIRVACPQVMPPGATLGKFLRACRETLETEDEILSQSRFHELEGFLEYASRYNHDTNPAYATEAIDDSELKNFVRKTVSFTGLGS